MKKLIYPYKIESKEDLYRLSELATKENYPILIRVGNDLIDAKSLLALFTIIGKEVNLVAPDHVNGESFVNFIKRLENK